MAGERPLVQVPVSGIRRKRFTEHGETCSKGVLVVLSIGCFLQHVACGDASGVGEPMDSSTSFEIDTLQALLKDVGSGVILPTLEQFIEGAQALEDAAEAWANATHAGEAGVDEHIAAQDAWWIAMATWQELEVMQVGPAGSSLSVEGGLDLRDEMYSWPSVNTCRIDQETVDDAWGTSSFFSDSLVNVYGLDALEYLLFTEDSDNTCPGQIDINATGQWADLGDAGVSQSRSAYAHAVATHVHDVGQNIYQTWTPDGGDFGAQLAGSRKASTYEDSTAALNAIFDALFYLETHTKDEKLAHPLGLLDCGYTDCLEDLESPHAHGSTAWVHANLLGFQKLFTGAGGTGIDDLLVEMGHQELADRMNENLSQAIDTSGSLDVALDALFMRDRNTALRLYDEVKAVTDDLKGDLRTVLSLQIPSEAAGDND